MAENENNIDGAEQPDNPLNETDNVNERQNANLLDQLRALPIGAIYKTAEGLSSGSGSGGGIQSKFGYSNVGSGATITETIGFKPNMVFVFSAVSTDNIVGASNGNTHNYLSTGNQLGVSGTYFDFYNAHLFKVNNFTDTGFDIYSEGGSTSVAWIAIG